MIYIQSDKERKLPEHFDAACALYGAIDSCLDYRLTSYEEIQSGKFDKFLNNKLFVGSTDFMSLIFQKLNLNPRVPRNSNRENLIMTLSEAREFSKTKNVFIKPLEIKLFTGCVLDGINHSSLANIPPNTKVFVYDVFKPNLVSEWRIYIKNNQIIDSRNYSGDFMISPDYEYVKSVIKENIGFPMCYTIDIGILKNNENVIVEFNDMWAIGNYGVPNDIYLNLLKERYFEIVKSTRYIC